MFIMIPAGWHLLPFYNKMYALTGKLVSVPEMVHYCMQEYFSVLYVFMSNKKSGIALRV